MLIDELDDLRREILAERAPVGTRRAVADGGAGDGGCSWDARRCGRDDRDDRDHCDEPGRPPEKSLHVVVPPCWVPSGGRTG